MRAPSQRIDSHFHVKVLRPPLASRVDLALIVKLSQVLHSVLSAGHSREKHERLTGAGEDSMTTRWERTAFLVTTGGGKALLRRPRTQRPLLLSGWRTACSPRP